MTPISLMSTDNANVPFTSSPFCQKTQWTLGIVHDFDLKRNSTSVLPKRLLGLILLILLHLLVLWGSFINVSP
jgi:hypothetical protein